MTTLTATLPPRRFSLARMFLAACLVVMAAAMLLVGTWVETRIEQAVVQNSANAAALYMESFISPLSQDLAQGDVLPGPAARALVEIYEHTPLGERVAAYRIWKPGGLLAHASDPAEIGQIRPEPLALVGAWNGRITGGFATAAAGGPPLLQVWSPIRELWSGQIVAVAEFYVRSEALQAELADAREKSWVVVWAVFSISTLMLFGIVLAGDRLIKAQAAELEDRVRQSEAMAVLNRDLRTRALDASARATAEADRMLRRLGSDLHDGPAQYLALAALRLDSALGGNAARPNEVAEIRKAIDGALAEIRTLSRGLVIPDIDSLSLERVIERAVAGSRALSGIQVDLDCPAGLAPSLDYAGKLCVYRFLQETLSNVARHGAAARCRVTCTAKGARLRLQVADEGPGFDPEREMRLRADGGQGLMGLVDRAESLGGEVEVRSAPGGTTTVSLILPLERKVIS
jgi:signal transduction histidine kinase